jgi:uracil-DNA glycosylase family 4
MGENLRESLWDAINDLEDSLRHGRRVMDKRPQLPPAPAGIDGPPAMEDPGLAGDSLDAISAEVLACTRCALHQGRNRAVPGAGDAERCRVMVIGEAPRAEEDSQGLPFVGPAGIYLDRWLGAIGLSRENGAFIANTIKCRPPGNRDPLPEETGACIPYLLRQISLLQPEVILCVGRISTSILLGEEVRIGRSRGRWMRFQGIPMIATYHPSAVLRNDELRRPVWEDMKKLKAGLDSGIYRDEVS